MQVNQCVKILDKNSRQEVSQNERPEIPFWCLKTNSCVQSYVLPWRFPSGRPCEMKRRADLAVGTLYLTFFLYIYRKHSHDKYLPCLALESVPTVKNHKAE